MRLYINDELVDLDAGQTIAQTKQVNDLNSIDNRDANFTNIFTVPKTANNVRIMRFMSLTGNNSRVPYQKNTCKLYSATGECFIYNGWAIVTDAGKNYEIAVIDGIIDLYKAIENLNLSDLDLSELEHSKTVPNVIGSWTTSKPYKYILADYNGDTGNVNTDPGILPEVNIDYLVPSVNVAWLWNKIKDTFGFTFNGSVFSTYNFTELWMTYPKGQTISGENDHSVFKSNDGVPYTPTGNSNYFAKWNSFQLNELQSLISNVHMQVATTGTYKVRVKGKLFGFRGGDTNQPRDARIYLGKNKQNASSTSYSAIPVFIEIQNNVPHGQDFDITSDTFSLDELDTICLLATIAYPISQSYVLMNGYDNHFEIDLIRVDPNTIDFSEAFTDFSIKDFMNEVVQRFGLTMFKDKYSQSYTFLTLKEQLLNAPTVDWSDKLSEVVNENYIYGSYARRNYFRYNYNDKESSHNDWYIDVANVNLQDKKDAIKSKIYSPERFPTTYINESVNVYKLWDKEVVENPGPDEEPVKYNPLDKRYYFLRSVRRDINIKVISKELAGMDSTASFFYRENYYNLPFYDILQEYYLPLKQILNSAIIANAQLLLSDFDIVNFDFKKLYYFKQLGNYFLVNKINNFVPGKLTKCELVRVVFEELADPPQAIKITKVITNNYAVQVFFELAVDVPWITFQYSLNGTSFSSLIMSSTSNPIGYSLNPGTNFVRIKAGTDFSNTVQFNLPSSQIIIP